jgi:hypothetical protein
MSPLPTLNADHIALALLSPPQTQTQTQAHTHIYIHTHTIIPLPPLNAHHTALTLPLVAPDTVTHMRLCLSHLSKHTTQ